MAPETIGPYRIGGRIGVGGMGEVFVADDPRLDRRVAIKIVRRDASAGEATRRRFLREARLAAAVSHPSIVQIFDIVEDPSGDAIVMELVEGTTLADLLRRGPLPWKDVCAYGRDIALGLARAHDRGLVHRDLKCENLMLTETGDIKILDFGIAKRLDPAVEGTALTADGAVVGSCHAMSPEQALGYPVDPRSDLFSLGVVLYEMATGVSPFRAERPVASLARVSTHRPPPIDTLVPAVPGGLAALIEELLEKDPADRPAGAPEVAARLERSITSISGTGRETRLPASETDLLHDAEQLSAGSLGAATREGFAMPATEVPAEGAWRRRARRLGRRSVASWLAGGLGVTVFAALGLWRLAASPPPLHIAVLTPEQATTTADGDLVAAALRAGLLDGIEALRAVTVPAFDRVDMTTGTSADVARALAADEALTARLVCGRTSCSVTLARIAAAAGNVLRSRRFDLPTDDLLLLATASAAQARQLYAERPARRDAAHVPEVSAADYAGYLAVRRDFAHRDRRQPLAELLARLGAIEASSPRFAPAFVLDARIAHHRHGETRDSRDLERALDRAERAAELAPADPLPRLFQATIASAAGRLDAAEAVLAELDLLLPGDPRVTASRAQLAERRGDGTEALALARRAAARLPSWVNLFNLAGLELRQGEVEAAKKHIILALERAPENFRCRSMLAEIELIYGDLEQAITGFRSLAEASGGHRELSNLGVAYLLAGRYPEAAEAFGRAYSLAPSDPQASLNLADARQLLGETAAAARLYRETVARTEGLEAGVGEARFLTVRAQAQAHLGDAREAAAAAREALRLHPDDPWVTYEAALVFALIGERSSALAGLERALDLGVARRWLRLPWLVPLDAELALTRRSGGVD